jgi:hypothetical protein
MERPKRAIVVLIIAIGALVVAAGAGGYGAGRAQDIPRGNTATFLPSHWSCRNLGPSVKCQSGDAFPNATLTTTRSGGITVKVHTLPRLKEDKEARRAAQTRSKAADAEFRLGRPSVCLRARGRKSR